MDESATTTAAKTVNLIVKASNQQYDDQNIECQPNWTIGKLKEHLCDVYPSKPKPSDQKLIYSGQLLKDTLILKDILRHYEGIQQQKHTFHLVCAPKQRFPLSSASSSSSQKSQQTSFATETSDGLRQRQRSTAVDQNIASSSGVSAAATNIPSSMPIINGNCPSFLAAAGASLGGNIPASFNPIGFQQQFQMPSDYLLAQHAAAMQTWMQQAYVQYMNQYMNLMSTGVRPETVFMQNPQPIPTTTTAATMPLTNISGGSVPLMPYVPQNFPFASTNLPSAGNSPATVPVSPTVQATPQTQQQLPQPTVAPQQQDPPRPRYPNIIQDDVQENRDWLDVFYSVSRLMFLLTIVYLYSSPVRCLLVFVIVLVIYVYHNVYFRTQRQDDNNNGAVRQPQQPNNVVANDAVDNNEAAVIPSDQQQNSSENTDTTEQETVPTDTAEAADGTSTIALLRTFVVSFIVSLLPETPPV